jgi:hypothetical protein
VLDGSTVIQDLNGLGWRHTYGPGIDLVKKLVKLDEVYIISLALSTLSLSLCVCVYVH